MILIITLDSTISIIKVDNNDYFLFLEITLNGLPGNHHWNKIISLAERTRLIKRTYLILIHHH